MKKFLFVGGDGSPLYTASPQVDETYISGALYGEMLCVEVPIEEDDNFLLGRCYVKDGVLKTRPDAPSAYHTWSLDSETWLPNLDAAKATKKAEIETELSRRLYLPCNGFDADKISRERIGWMIARLQRGDGLPTGWVGWRDADNNMHWAADDAAIVLTNLTALSRAIEDREQALLVASWTHKANIAALEDIDAILAYDVTKNWPT